jgi:ferric-dicitrate binding protein FerR (iron transport regulator)
VREGTAWGVTGPDFPGRALRVDTDQARIRVSGTTFAVVSGGDTTCVCVLNGDVEVKCKITGVVLSVHSVQQLLLDAAGPERRLSPLSPLQHELLRDVRDHTVF